MDGVTTVPDLDALWDALWADLRRNATGKPSGDAIIHRHRAAIEAEARASQPLTLDVERLADAVAAALPVPSMLDVDFADGVAVDIAGEYERLGKP